MDMMPALRMRGAQEEGWEGDDGGGDGQWRAEEGQSVMSIGQLETEKTTIRH